jgi:antitoxin (DNA-binding transcriptional repressor) of toxin-antitoxin stability system
MEGRMESVNMHEAKTRLSQLVARAAKGEAFIIAKAGEFKVPDDFDRMGQDEITELFGG